MHTSEVDVMLRLKDLKFEVKPTLSRGQWGATQDDAGGGPQHELAALFVDIVSTPYYARNPNLLRTRGSYETLDTGDLNTTWPLRPTPGVNRGYQDGVPARQDPRGVHRRRRADCYEAIGCRRSCRATCSWWSRPRTW